MSHCMPSFVITITACQPQHLFVRTNTGTLTIYMPVRFEVHRRSRPRQPLRICSRDRSNGERRDVRGNALWCGCPRCARRPWHRRDSMVAQMCAPRCSVHPCCAANLEIPLQSGPCCCHPVNTRRAITRRDRRSIPRPSSSQGTGERGQEESASCRSESSAAVRDGAGEEDYCASSSLEWKPRHLTEYQKLTARA